MGYEPYMGEIPVRTTGSLVAFEQGTATAYGIWNVQDRGTMFVDPGLDVYEGMIVGVSPKLGDIVINVCKKKHLTNTRASGSDEALRLVPPRHLSLEESLEFISDDELVEVTPKNIRLRKRILDSETRAKADAKKRKG
jgi:GTP-binding protein